MLWTLIGMVIRHLVTILVNVIAANPNFAKWLGDDFVNLLKQESTVVQIVAAVITLLSLAWSARNKIYDKLETLKGIARPRSTTVAEVKAEVKAESATVAGIAIPSKEQMTEAFQTPVEKVINRDNL
jgi:hypothetical protein